MDNKKITFHTTIKKTATQQPIETTWCVFASDYNSVQVEFVVADLRPDEIRTVNPTIVLIMEDGSTVQRTNEQIVQKNNVFSYKLKDREGQHIGVVKAQLKLETVTGETFQSNIYTFTILESLDSVPVPKEFVIDDIQNIIREIKHHITHIFKDEETRKQVFADTIKNLMVNEKQRETWFNQSQQTRTSLFQVFMDEAQDVLNDAQQVKDLFDELVETGIVESNIADKLSDLEVSYAPRLSTLEQNDVSLTAQLQQAVGAVTVDSEVVLARGGETTLGQRLDKQGTLLTTLYQEKANKVQEAWITPTLLNGWVVANNNPVGYMKDEMGFVHLKGDIKGGAEVTTVIQFPVGYRPKGGTPSYIITRYSTTIARFIVFENGTTWVRITGGSADKTGYSLDGITFRAEG